MSELGLVVIGRNEGERLIRCLDSLRGAGLPLVYVDSASSDGSVAAARARGAEVVEVDPSRPMNAARSRNEGFARLTALHPATRYVQFVDGDTALAPGWLEAARAALAAAPRRGVVAGHLGERLAGRSVFHLLCALEWRRAPGPVQATGGIFMVRADAFAAAGGFDGGLPAGEEAELCQRIRAQGLVVEQLDVPMGTHDVGQMDLRRWWLRNARVGHGFALAATGGGPGGARDTRELRSALAWGLALPLAALLGALLLGPLALLLLLAWPLQAARVARGALGRGWTLREAGWYGAFVVAAKLPECAGALRLLLERLRGAAPRLIEYK